MFNFSKKKREKKEKERLAREEREKLIAQANKDIEELKAINKYLDELIAKHNCRPTLESIEEAFRTQEEISKLI